MDTSNWLSILMWACTVASLAGGLLAAFKSLKAQMEANGERLDKLDVKVSNGISDKLHNVDITVARMETQIAALPCVTGDYRRCHCEDD